MYIDRIKNTHPLAHVGAVCGLAITACLCLWILSVREVTLAQKGAATAAIHEEADKTRTWLVSADGPITKLDNQITGLRADTFREIHLQAGGLQEQITGIRMDASKNMVAVVEIAHDSGLVLNDFISGTQNHANGALDAIAGLRSDMKPTLANAASLSAQFADAAPLFLDCEANQDCLFNRYVGASKGIEKAAINFGAMSADVRAALPAFQKTWTGIGANVQETTLHIADITKPHWYDRLLGYALNGAVLYRNVNPASLTVKGIQTISSVK